MLLDKKDNLNKTLSDAHRLTHMVVGVCGENAHTEFKIRNLSFTYRDICLYTDIDVSHNQSSNPPCRAVPVSPTMISSAHTCTNLHIPYFH